MRYVQLHEHYAYDSFQVDQCWWSSFCRLRLHAARHHWSIDDPVSALSVVNWNLDQISGQITLTTTLVWYVSVINVKEALADFSVVLSLIYALWKGTRPCSIKRVKLSSACTLQTPAQECRPLLKPHFTFFRLSRHSYCPQNKGNTLAMTCEWWRLSQDVTATLVGHESRSDICPFLANDRETSP